MFCYKFRTWRGPTTTAPRPKHIQIFTRPQNQLMSDIKHKNMDSIMDRLRDSAYGNNNNNNDDDYEYYYDNYSYEENDSKPQTLIAATTAKPMAAAQYLPYFNRPYNRNNKDGNLKNSFVSPSYKQKPLVLSHYYKKRKKK